jgi:hypothetical protein
MHRAEALSPTPSRSANRIEAGASKVANLPNDIRECTTRQRSLDLSRQRSQHGSRSLNNSIFASSKAKQAEPFGVGAGGTSRKGARELAAWLNALPEVQSMLRAQFNGSPVSEVNLTHWRQGGYLQWITERECFESARALAEGDCDLASTGLSAERLLNVLTVRFGQLLMRWDSSADESGSDESRDCGMLGGVSGKEAEPIGVGAGGVSGKEASPFSEVAKKARILQGISRSVLAIHRLQSQSALKKSDPATSFAGAHSRPEPDPKPCPETVRPLAKGKAKGEIRDGGMLVSDGKGKSANEEGTPRNGTIFPPASRSALGKILSDPIMPSNLSHMPFKPDQNIEEILNAV